MTEYMTQEEVAERERAVDAFMAFVALAETKGDVNVSLRIADAIEVRNELERLEKIERAYDDMASAALDRLD